MKCWRYLNRKWGLKALETGLFKMSTRNEFNDVLDSVGYHCGRYTKEYIEQRLLTDERHQHDKFRYDEVQRRFPRGSERTKYQRELRDGLSDRICRNLNYEEQHHLIPGKPDLILCMSMDRDEHDKAVARDEALLWGHYADGGRGLRIGIEFDATFDDFLEVMKYSKVMPVCNLRQYRPQMTFEDMKRIGHEFRYRAVTTKSVSWQYEHEVRLIFSADERLLKRSNGLCFLPVKKSCIWRVDFGPLCFKNEAAFIRKVQQLRKLGYTNTRFRMAGVDPTTYAYRFLTEYYIGSGVSIASACGHPNSFFFPPLDPDDESNPLGTPYLTF